MLIIILNSSLQTNASNFYIFILISPKNYFQQMEPNLDNSHTYYTIFKNHPPTITCYLVCCETIINHSEQF